MRINGTSSGWYQLKTAISIFVLYCVVAKQSLIENEHLLKFPPFRYIAGKS